MLQIGSLFLFHTSFSNPIFLQFSNFLHLSQLKSQEKMNEPIDKMHYEISIQKVPRKGKETPYGSREKTGFVSHSPRPASLKKQNLGHQKAWAQPGMFLQANQICGITDKQKSPPRLCSHICLQFREKMYLDRVWLEEVFLGEKVGGVQEWHPQTVYYSPMYFLEENLRNLLSDLLLPTPNMLVSLVY